MPRTKTTAEDIKQAVLRYERDITLASLPGFEGVLNNVAADIGEETLNLLFEEFLGTPNCRYEMMARIVKLLQVCLWPSRDVKGKDDTIKSIMGNVKYWEWVYAKMSLPNAGTSFEKDEVMGIKAFVQYLADAGNRAQEEAGELPVDAEDEEYTPYLLALQ